MAICAARDASGGAGINPDPDDTSAPSSGATHVLVRRAGRWQTEGYLKASNPGADDQLGGDAFALALSSDGSTLAVGARLEDSRAAGLGGDGTDNSAPDSGAVYVY